MVAALPITFPLPPTAAMLRHYQLIRCRWQVDSPLPVLPVTRTLSLSTAGAVSVELGFNAANASGGGFSPFNDPPIKVLHEDAR